MRRHAWSYLVAAVLAAVSCKAGAHAGVFVDEDVCTLRVGFFEAELKLFQPRESRHEAFCEAVPKATETVLVMEYRHGPLQNVPIELRIIEDVTGRGRFATLADVSRAGGLEEATVYYEPPSVHRDVFSIVHDFEAPGWYIGMVTVEHPTLDKTYTAVFPFEVGFAGVGSWPWLAALAVAVQLHYSYSNGHFARWMRRLRTPTGSDRAAAVKMRYDGDRDRRAT